MKAARYCDAGYWDAALVAFFAVHMSAFYFWIIPTVGAGVADKCLQDYMCNRFIRRTSLGYTVDLADGQWREFRGSLWLLALTAAGTSALSYLLRRMCHRLSPTSSCNALSALRVVVGVVIVFVQHGYHGFIILTIALLGFAIARLSGGGWVGRGLTWTYAVGVLLFKESYRVKHIPVFRFLGVLFDRRYGGMYGWQLPANFLTLRIISFSLDYYDHLARDASKRGPGQGEGSSSLHTHPSPPSCSFSLLHCMAYVTYAPLYMAGPVITFTDFMRCTWDSTANSQVALAGKDSKGTSTGSAGNVAVSSKSSSDDATDVDDVANVKNRVTRSATATATASASARASAPASTTAPRRAAENLPLYFARLLGCLLLMEFLLHRFPFFAVVSSRLMQQLSAAETAVVCYVVLKMMWLKFLLIWRFFRMWALAEGVDPPENMLKCMSNNHSLEGFWRGWHASFNRWLVQYVYKPMGGREARFYSVWVIFLFVALWHDLEVKLLAWGLLNASFYVVEVWVKRIARPGLASLHPAAYALLTAAAGAVYVMVLIAVNLTGYATGVGGMSMLLQKVGSAEGVQMVLVSLYFLTVGVLLMQYLKRKGVAKED